MKKMEITETAKFANSIKNVSTTDGKGLDEKRKLKKDKNTEAIINLKQSIPDIDNIFDIHGRVGNGTFSTVFLGSMKCEHGVTQDKRKLFAIKHLIPTSHPNRIIKELKCLVEIGGVDNVAGINLCLRRNESVAFVMPYIPHDRFQDYYDKMHLNEIREYLRNLLIALRRVHSFSVIHRDVKPSNFLYNRKTKQFMLVDFGLAQTVINPIESIDNNSKRKISNTILNELGGHGDANKKTRVGLVESDITPMTYHQQAGQDAIDDNDGNGTNNNKSPFKMPLKQVNDILPPSRLKNQIKSTVLSLSMGNRLQQQDHNKQQQQNQQQMNQQRNQPSTSQISQQQTTNSNNDNISSNTITNKYNYQNRQQTITPGNNTSSPNNNNNNSNNNKCTCFGKSQVCNTCLIRKEIPASRAGTPGYRPPEVLLKYTDQTCSVDIWAVGVIFISILSGVYPFFKAPDDFVALAEIVMLFGDETIRKTAFTLDRHVTMSRKCKPLDLRKLCVRLKNRTKIDRSEILKKYQANGKKCEECTNCQQMFFDCLCEDTKYKTEPIGDDYYPNSAYDLLSKLLEVNPHKRINAQAALDHPFLRE